MIALILPSGFMDFALSLPVAVFSAVLAASAPAWPRHDLKGIGWWDPHQMPGPPPHLGHVRSRPRWSSACRRCGPTPRASSPRARMSDRR